jgi:predicted TPR repeat methyltransferase
MRPVQLDALTVRDESDEVICSFEAEGASVGDRARAFEIFALMPPASDAAQDKLLRLLLQYRMHYGYARALGLDFDPVSETAIQRGFFGRQLVVDGGRADWLVPEMDVRAGAVRGLYPANVFSAIGLARLAGSGTAPAGLGAGGRRAAVATVGDRALGAAAAEPDLSRLPAFRRRLKRWHSGWRGASAVRIVRRSAGVPTMNAPTNPTPAAREVTMTLEEALAYAVQRHQAGDLDQAEPIYEAVLQRQPDRVEVLNYMGILKHQRGELADAAALMRRLVQLQPEADGVWNNLGNVLMRLGRTDEAADAFERSLGLVPSAHAWSNLARVFRKRDDLARSEQACLQALALESDHGPATHNLALALILDGRVEAGVAAALRAMQLLPPGQQRRQLYMHLLLLHGETAQAVVILRAWLVQEPDNPYVQHHLAACTGEGAPERASDAYVEKLFDNFAPTFDDKLASLHYRAPQVVADAVATRCPRLRPAWRSPTSVAARACAGRCCGRGQAVWSAATCPARCWSARVGAARTTSCTRPNSPRSCASVPDAFDLVVSADTLNYFGELGGVAAGGARRAASGRDLRLHARGAGRGRGRNAQAAGQRPLRARRRACTARVRGGGLQVDAPVEAVLREEKQLPVRGWLMVARRLR